MSTAQRFRNLFPSMAAAQIFERVILSLDDDDLPAVALKVKRGEDVKGSRAYWEWLCREATAPDDSVLGDSRHDVVKLRQRERGGPLVDAGQVEEEVEDRRAFILNLWLEIQDARTLEAWADAADMSAEDLELVLARLEDGEDPTADEFDRLRAAAVEVLSV